MVEIRARWVHVSNGELQIDAYLAEPLGEGTHPGVIVIQEIFGVNSHIQSVTERLAQEGYVAIAPAIFQRTAPGFEVGYTEADTIQGRTYKDLTTAEELLSDIQATIDYLKTNPKVKDGGFGAIGFCFGGHVVYLAATLPDIRATASFYGGGIATLTPGGGDPTITRTPEIKGTLYAFFGLSDPLIPNDQADQIEAQLRAHSIPHRVFRYPAGHGFFCDQRADYNPEAAKDAWEHVKQLFRDQLG
jgi:carboxymethylenebutenolidase